MQRPRWAVWASAGVIAAFTAIVFSSARHGALLAWDDDINITTNPHLRGLTWENVRWMFTDFEYMRRYTPLAWLGWAIDYQWFGLTAQSCHVGNILIHAVNAALAFLLAFRVMEIRRRDMPRRDAPWMGALAGGAAALLWAVHPLRVEVVAWASGRIYAQAIFFLLVAALAYLKAHATDRAPQRVWLRVSLVAFTISLLTYPLGVTFVAVLVILDVYVLRRFQGTEGVWSGSQARPIWCEKIPFLIVTAAVLSVTLFARYHAKGMWAPPPTLAQFGITARVMQAFYIWAHYVWRPFVPTDLAPVYTTLVEFDPAQARFILSALAVVMLSVVLFWKRRQWPGLFALWLCHLVLLVPTLGLTEHPHYPNDRYGYLVELAWVPAVAVFFVGHQSGAVRRVLLAVTAGIIPILAILSSAQIRIWRDSETLFRYLESKLGSEPYQADVTLRLGEILRMGGRLAEANTCYARTLQIDPAGPRASQAHFGLGLIAQAQGQNDVAAREYQEAIRLNPTFASAYFALGDLLAIIGRYPEARAFLERAIELDPANPGARAALQRLPAQ